MALTHRALARLARDRRTGNLSVIDDAVMRSRVAAMNRKRKERARKRAERLAQVSQSMIDSGLVASAPSAQVAARIERAEAQREWHRRGWLSPYQQRGDRQTIALRRADDLAALGYTPQSAIDRLEAIDAERALDRDESSYISDLLGYGVSPSDLSERGILIAAEVVKAKSDAEAEKNQSVFRELIRETERSVGGIDASLVTHGSRLSWREADYDALRWRTDGLPLARGPINEIRIVGGSVECLAYDIPTDKVAIRRASSGEIEFRRKAPRDRVTGDDIRASAHALPDYMLDAMATLDSREQSRHAARQAQAMGIDGERYRLERISRAAKRRLETGDQSALEAYRQAELDLAALRCRKDWRAELAAKPAVETEESALVAMDKILCGALLAA